MDPHLILSHKHLNEGFDAIASAQHFLNTGRPLNEVLSLVDQGLVGLHDAKGELVKFREVIYLRHQASINEEARNLSLAAAANLERMFKGPPATT